MHILLSRFPFSELVCGAPHLTSVLNLLIISQIYTAYIYTMIFMIIFMKTIIIIIFFLCNLHINFP